MRLGVAIVACLLIALLAGCTGAGKGSSAMDVRPALDAEAKSWHADALLLSLEAEEVSGLNDTVASGLGVAGIPADTTVGDGQAQTWYAQYYSPSAKMLVNLAWADGKASRVSEFKPTSVPDASQLETAATSWTVDSPEAAQNLMANATFAQAVASPAVRVLMGFHAQDGGRWLFYADTAQVHIEAWVTGAGKASIISVAVRAMQGFNIPHPSALPPPPLHKEGDVDSSADPLNLGTAAICTTPTAKCVHIPIQVNTTASMEATLAWSRAGDDFDLYLYQNGTLVSNDGTNSAPDGAVTQVMHADLEPGLYDLVVVPWNAVQDHWTLDATFTTA